MNIREFEDKVWELEAVRIVVRSPSADGVNDYSYKNKAKEQWRITQLLQNRVAPKIGQCEVIVIGGDGEEPHGATLLRTLRKSYERS